MKKATQLGVFFILFGMLLLMACSSKSDDYEPPRDEEESMMQISADSLSAVQNSKEVNN